MDIGEDKMTTYHVPKIGASFREIGSSKSEMRRWWNNYWEGQLEREEDKVIFKSQLSGEYRINMTPEVAMKAETMNIVCDLFFKMDEAIWKRLVESGQLGKRR